jgi:predicted protein tyrosine phosphatase
MTAKDALWIVLRQNPDAMKLYEQVKDEVIRTANQGERRTCLDIPDDSINVVSLIVDMLKYDNFKVHVHVKQLIITF